VDAFWVALVKPFMAVVFMLPGWYVKRWMQRRWPDSPVVRFLTVTRGARMQAWFERQDARIYAAFWWLVSVIRRGLRPPRVR